VHDVLARAGSLVRSAGIFTVLAAVAAADVALAAALAFGLGGRELARTGAHRIRRNREPRRPVI
jgi:hypothetical protein